MQPSNPLPVMIREESTLMRNWVQVEVSNGLEYYNPNPWSRILGRANETDMELMG